MRDGRLLMVQVGLPLPARVQLDQVVTRWTRSPGSELLQSPGCWPPK